MACCWFDGALSRRTGVTFGDGSTQAYAYEPDDDLASIGHDFAGSPDDVTYSYGYDGAGRETSVVVSNSAYQLHRRSRPKPTPPPML